MNTTSQTLALTGNPTQEVKDEIVKAQIVQARARPDENLAKSISPAFASRFATPSPLDQLPPEALAELEKLGAPSLRDYLTKTVSTGTGLTAFDLQAPAKYLVPFVTPITNYLPRVGGGVGTGTNWRQINALIGSGFDAMGWVPEGQRAGTMNYTTTNKVASFATIGEEDAATWEALHAAVGFEDLPTTLTYRLMQKMRLKEEMALLGGNATLDLGVPTTPTLSNVTVTGGTTSNATYYVQVVALTIEGYANAAKSAPLAAPPSVLQTGADGRTFLLNGGSSSISALSSSQTANGTTALAMSTPAIQGAVAYAWYIGNTATAGTGRLQAITGINSYVLSVPLTTTGQLASAMVSDYSMNPTFAFDGLFTTAVKAGSGADITVLPTGTAGTGTTLTSSGRGSVVEIDNMFNRMWDNYQVSPSVLFVNSQELRNITSKVFSGGANTPLLRFNAPNGEQRMDVSAGSAVRWYYNPFSPMDEGMMVEIRVHPKMPPGTILGWAQNLPIQYQSNHVPNVAEVKTRRDYYQVEWPIVTRQLQVGVYAEEVLAVYAPFAMGVISNIANG